MTGRTLPGGLSVTRAGLEHPPDCWAGCAELAHGKALHRVAGVAQTRGAQYPPYLQRQALSGLPRTAVGGRRANSHATLAGIPGAGVYGKSVECLPCPQTARAAANGWWRAEPISSHHSTILVAAASDVGVAPPRGRSDRARCAGVGDAAYGCTGD